MEAQNQISRKKAVLFTIAVSYIRSPNNNVAHENEAQRHAKKKQNKNENQIRLE